MKRIEFRLTGTPAIGGGVDVDVSLAGGDGDAPPRSIPMRYNGHHIDMPAVDGVVHFRIEFPTEGMVTLEPAEGYEGDALVLNANRAA
jgi:hypothetical protein